MGMRSYVMENKIKRIWEIDFLRGIALILMIVFHIIFDLREIYNLPIDYSSGIVYYIGKTAAILFMLISGISSSFSKSNIKRGIKIFAIAMAITIVTHLFDPAFGIKFGILHFFGIAMILFPLFKPLNKYWLVVIGTLIIAAGSYMSGVRVQTEFLFPIGLISRDFVSSDYYPLFPWLGVFLYGIAIGKVLYKEKKSLLKFSIKDNFISFAGKYTLTVYVAHQPVILLVLSLIMGRI